MDNVKKALLEEGRDARNMISFFIPTSPNIKKKLLRQTTSPTTKRARSQSPLDTNRRRGSSTGKRTPRSSVSRKRLSSKDNTSKLNNSAPDLSSALSQLQFETNIDETSK